ncbi:hypothetical protein NDU88_001278 [Pleurodeles waltl]|uniref:Uncharacterized protein n=1 Tax=Pleurodeles waltl TaxID=8319 RepID=A0AAV7LAZ1_PLEWA|nr:hypothetical protein NDU88_001278 [Pleurodeles waltl]
MPLPVFHASLLGGGLLQGDVVLGREGAQAARDDGHGAEPGARGVHHVGGAGVLLAVPLVPIAALQVVLRAGDGHLHGSAAGPRIAAQVSRVTARPAASLDPRGTGPSPAVRGSLDG